jgi:GTP cyclohydrolase I
MNAPDFRVLPDIQSIVDQRRIAIQRVGIKDVRFPMSVTSPDGSSQPTVAQIDMDVGLPADQKGTHMSRFLEILEAHEGPLGTVELPEMMQRMLVRLQATTGRIEFRFPYFVRKAAPISGVSSLLDYQVTLRGETLPNGEFRLTLKVLVPVTSLCPCSKEISDYGAHNQRSHISISAELAGSMAIEELIRIAEEEASCQVYGLLKRPDEKYVTERAYDNPKFVEDLVRDIALRLNGEPRIRAYVLESENFESIHNHSAYALIEHRKGA